MGIFVHISSGRTQMSYKRLTPCIFIDKGKAVRWFDDKEVIADNVISLAKHYGDMGADELIVFDLSDSDEEHEQAFDLIKRINRVISIPMIAGGNISRQEDVKKFLYAGARRAMLNFSKPESIDLIEEVSKRFGKERIAVSLNDFDALFKQQHLIEECGSEIIFMHRLDLNSVMNVTQVPCVVVTDTMEQDEILKILKNEGIKGVSGLFISQKDIDYHAFKDICLAEGIHMTSFESMVDFSEFKLNSDGLLPVIVQDYKTNEVLMLAYMDEEAFDHTVKSGKMTYYSRSRKEQWVKGATSGHFQYVKTLTMDCDNDTLLAKVEQIGAACHTGSHSCFFQPVVGSEYDVKNPLQVFESVYATIADRKQNPKEGSYTNYLFDKGIDKILKKVGEEAAEIIIAAKNSNPEEVKYEMSDFLYHAMVLMVEKGITWEDITNELADR
ncbi:phosphoribosyl-ATP pyrophosphatase /phosphoribosyl-AMP cyclohydrolase [Muricomes intestini]|uniref:Histidine biosynthesis bifunctional protein HisIE n=4 Tax=Muricomes intestini TaxID=1796634 RepID=A0A4R3KHQ1_9FIRM|nr:phosphoribosyl-ATP pyrophosphatase /phosphoribosyl-AMP cyclohydrolase [Muricomes intestini]